MGLYIVGDQSDCQLENFACPVDNDNEKDKYEVGEGLVVVCNKEGCFVEDDFVMDFLGESVLEVLRLLYESSEFLTQKLTIVALQHIRQIAQESSGEIEYGGGRQPVVLITFSQRLCRGFNDVVNGYVDDGWSLMEWKI
ncbi:hypothetical protein JHK82_027952 [Glycine max]|nr:hypothetical protein JHK85_028614 [Glycine max]KAG5003938.1 hypothetical protein JHK86_028077 [Glycine max]KAG5127117.1 hypothetical protein JHK82_027952 [Glycine max]KAG5151732.1 hypothetical protein JHK84_028204 [Glycine max]